MYCAVGHRHQGGVLYFLGAAVDFSIICRCFVISAETNYFKKTLLISAALYFALGYFGCVIYQSKLSPIAFADSFKLSLICLLVEA
jgi:hypothetical protein